MILIKAVANNLTLFNLQVVVSEETVEKVTTFCAHKKTGTITKGQNSAEDNQAAKRGQADNQSVSQGSFEFGDFIRAFKVSSDSDGYG